MGGAGAGIVVEGPRFTVILRFNPTFKAELGAEVDAAVSVLALGVGDDHRAKLIPLGVKEDKLM